MADALDRQIHMVALRRAIDRRRAHEPDFAQHQRQAGFRPTVEPRTHLADFLRDSRDLTGTHLGCEHGVCGACTILVDGAPVRSCITYAVACDGAEVATIEGLDDDEITRELRDAFQREHALQCGYCTPGMLVSARDLVLRLPDAGRAGNSRRDERQPLPLHRLCRHHPRHQERDRGAPQSAASRRPGRRPHGGGPGRFGSCWR